MSMGQDSSGDLYLQGSLGGQLKLKWVFWGDPHKGYSDRFAGTKVGMGQGFLEHSVLGEY